MATDIRHPVCVFTVEEHANPGATFPHPLRKRGNWTGKDVFKWLLLILATLALAGAASEIYILRRIQKNLDATQEMVHLNFDAQKMTAKSGDYRRQSVPSAHVTGTDKPTWSPGDLLQWEASQGLAFHFEVNYSNGSLICTKTGLYYVYSKLQLGYRSCPKTYDPTSYFTHGVYKKGPDSEAETELMNDRRSFCDSQGKEVWRGNSYLAGMVNIEQGAEIYVKMTEKRLVRVKDGTATFFGLFMV
ncbi:tumor necrosis factor ligand superfamily member 14 [Pelodytes ibericus]